MVMRMSAQLEERYDLAAIYAGDGARDTAATIAILTALQIEDAEHVRVALAMKLPDLRKHVIHLLSGAAD